MRKKLVVVFSAIMLLALTGFTVREWYDCKTCGGDGIMDARSCRSCGGDGEVTKPVRCPNCSGTGSVKDRFGDPVTCPKCEGTKGVMESSTCLSCSGSGVEEIQCPSCKGKGKVWRDE